MHPKRATGTVIAAFSLVQLMGLLHYLNPFAASFPAIPGGAGVHAVGYLSVHHPPRYPFELAEPTSQASGLPVLRVEEIGWSVFYPSAEDSRKKESGVRWLVGPKFSVIEGYSRFLGMSKTLLTPLFNTLASSLNIPSLHPSSPLLAPPATSTMTQDGKWPLLIFSHGLGGGRHVYSQLARYLASRGMVILVLDHKDGSGPNTVLHRESGEEDYFYVRKEEIEWKTKTVDPDNAIPLRHQQLKIRHAEVFEAYYAFSALISGDSSSIVFDDGQKMDASWADKVDTSQVYLGGHSFGGATTLHVLSNPPPGSFAPMPIIRALLLDPWLEPLPTTDDPKLALSSLPPALTLNSEGFTVWMSHYCRLVSIMEKWGGATDGIPRPDLAGSWFATIVRTTHQSFSDFPLLLSKVPFVGSQVQPADPAGLLHTIARLSASFLLSGIPDFPDPKGMRPADLGNVETEPVGKKGKERQQIVGAHGEVRVHFGETATSGVDSLTLQGEETTPKT